MGLIWRAHEGFSLFTLDDVEEESEQQSDVGVPVLLNQNHKKLLMFINWLTCLDQSSNMLAYFDYYISQI